MHLDHRLLAVNGIELSLYSAGPEHGKPVWLLHGFPECWYAWHPQIEALAARLEAEEGQDGYLAPRPRDRAAAIACGAAAVNASWFNQPLMIGAHACFAAFLILKTKALESEGFTKGAVQRYYQNIWYLFYSEYFLLPFI